MKKSRLEEIFLAAWLAEFPQLEPPTQQWGHNPDRRWRWDFAWPSDFLVVDLSGGTFMRGGHNRGVGMEKDYEKHNDAVRNGYRVLMFGTKSLKDPIEVVTYVAEVLCDAA